MTQDEFDKLYFKAKLAGARQISELMIQLVKDGEEEFAFELIRKYSPAAITAPIATNVSYERECKKSPYGLCYTIPLGQNIEQMNPDSIWCIFCEKIYTIDLTNTERKYIYDGCMVDDTSLLTPPIWKLPGRKNAN